MEVFFYGDKWCHIIDTEELVFYGDSKTCTLKYIMQNEQLYTVRWYERSNKYFEQGQVILNWGSTLEGR